MFDAKIDTIVDKLADRFGQIADDAVAQVREEAHDMSYLYIDQAMIKLKKAERELEDLSYQMKIVIGISLGLSVADTILLFSILKKMK